MPAEVHYGQHIFTNSLAVIYSSFPGTAFQYIFAELEQSSGRLSVTTWSFIPMFTFWCDILSVLSDSWYCINQLRKACFSENLMSLNCWKGLSKKLLFCLSFQCQHCFICTIDLVSGLITCKIWQQRWSFPQVSITNLQKGLFQRPLFHAKIN